MYPLALPPPILLETRRLRLALPGPDAAERTLAYVRANRAHLAPFEPERPPDYFTLDYWQRRLQHDREDLVYDRSLRLLLLPREPPFALAPVVGTASLTTFRRGPLQACELGYGLALSHQGQGLMTEALEALCDYAFRVLGFHRIQANHLPDNLRSAALLARLGFEREGVARGLLRIGGVWRDHVVTARLAPTRP